MFSAYETYRQTAVQTLPPERLIFMLYEGGIKYLRQAGSAMDCQEWVESSRHIRKAQDIVGELLSSINHEAGEMAQNLTGLYIYMNRRLSQAVIKRDPSPVQEVLQMLSELREAWGEILKKGSALQDAPAESAPAQGIATLGTPLRQGGFNFEG